MDVPRFLFERREFAAASDLCSPVAMQKKRAS
jgi:hypothetical protein